MLFIIHNFIVRSLHRIHTRLYVYMRVIFIHFHCHQRNQLSVRVVNGNKVGPFDQCHPVVFAIELEAKMFAFNADIIVVIITVTKCLELN